MLKEFRDFAMRGNVLDLAVGVIIGAAFGTIVSSLVDNVIMPPIGMLIGGIDFSSLKWVIQNAKEAVGVEGAPGFQAAIPEVAIGYGLFINAVIKFIIVAFAIFLLIKAVNKLLVKKDEAPPAPAEPTPDQKLLTEIRDLLKK
jgi:large conductance mechanosensitive channel